MMVNNHRHAPIRRDTSLIQREYRRKLRGLLRRNMRGKSVRAIARNLKVSHPTLLAIFKDPERAVSKKIMLRIIRRTTRKKPPERINPLVGLFVPDAI